MTRHFSRFFGIAITGIIFAGVAQAGTIGFSVSDNSPASGSDQLNVTVLDEQTSAPVSGASVSVTDGEGFGTPAFQMPADANGTAAFRDSAPVPKTVTVTKAGYASFTVVGIEGTDLTVDLKPLAPSASPDSTASTVLATGTITDWDGVSTDSSVARAGVVFRTVGAADLLNFQPSDFISPLSDTVDFGSIAGKHDIPSNVVLPQQDLSYLIVDISLNKPNYRLPIPAASMAQLSAVEIEADVSDLVSAETNHQMNIDLLNKLRFKRVGTTPAFAAAGSSVPQDVNADTALTQTAQVSISQAPPFTADVVGVAFTDLNGDKSVLEPNDAKVIYNHADGGDPSQAVQTPVTLATPESLPSSAKQEMAAIAMGTQGQISGVLVDPGSGTAVAGAFLNTDALPQDPSALPSSVTMHTPAQGVGAAIFEDTSGQPVWYVYSLPVAGDVQVPTSQVSGSAIGSYSVNQLEFSSFNPKALDGTQILSLMERFARSSAKIKTSTDLNRN